MGKFCHKQENKTTKEIKTMIALQCTAEKCFALPTKDMKTMENRNE